MPQVPKALTDLGLSAVSLFLFVAALYLILLIIRAVRAGKMGGGQDQGLPRCISSPLMATLLANQENNLRAQEKLEGVVQSLATNQALQTQLLQRVAEVQEDLRDCVLRNSAKG